MTLPKAIEEANRCECGVENRYQSGSLNLVSPRSMIKVFHANWIQAVVSSRFPIPLADFVLDGM